MYIFNVINLVNIKNNDFFFVKELFQFTFYNPFFLDLELVFFSFFFSFILAIIILYSLVIYHIMLSLLRIFIHIIFYPVCIIQIFGIILSSTFLILVIRQSMFKLFILIVLISHVIQAKAHLILSPILPFYSTKFIFGSTSYLLIQNAFILAYHPSYQPSINPNFSYVFQ